MIRALKRAYYLAVTEAVRADLLHEGDRLLAPDGLSLSTPLLPPAIHGHYVALWPRGTSEPVDVPRTRTMRAWRA